VIVLNNIIKRAFIISENDNHGYQNNAKIQYFFKFGDQWTKIGHMV